MLFTFAGIVATLLLLEIIAGSVIYGYRHTLTRKFEEKVNIGIADYYKENLNSTAKKWTRELIDKVQSGFECCGLEGFGDWANKQQAKFPSSCCPKSNTESEDKNSPRPGSSFSYDDSDTCQQSFVYRKGCKTAVTDWVKSMSTAIFIGALINALVFVAAIAASIWVGWTHKKNQAAA